MARGSGQPIPAWSPAAGTHPNLSQRNWLQSSGPQNHESQSADYLQAAFKDPDFTEPFCCPQLEIQSRS